MKHEFYFNSPNSSSWSAWWVTHFFGRCFSKFYIIICYCIVLKSWIWTFNKITISLALLWFAFGFDSKTNIRISMKTIYDLWTSFCITISIICLWSVRLECFSILEIGALAFIRAFNCAIRLYAGILKLIRLIKMYFIRTHLVNQILRVY